MEKYLLRENPVADDRVKSSLASLLSAAEHAREFIDGMSFEEFSRDRKTVFAVIRALEIIGQAAEETPEDFKVRNSSVSWRAMIERRKQLLHDYFKVDLNVIWREVNDLPELEAKIRFLLLGAHL